MGQLHNNIDSAYLETIIRICNGVLSSVSSVRRCLSSQGCERSPVSPRPTPGALVVLPYPAEGSQLLALCVHVLFIDTQIRTADTLRIESRD